MPTLKVQIDELSKENDHLANLVKAKEHSIEYGDRELAKARRMFMELYDQKHTLDMRFEWLEMAANEVITSCAEHRPNALSRLADEIGLEYTP